MPREDEVRRPLPVERDLGCHLALGAESAERHPCRLQWMLDRVHDRRRLIPTMHHTIGTLLVIAGAVGVPVGFLHQLLERLRVALAEQIAGALPAEIVSRRIAPRGATVGLVAGEEVEK